MSPSSGKVLESFMVELTQRSIDVARVIESVQDPAAGAVVLFLGTVRQTTGSRQTAALDYECYDRMARPKLAELEADACRRWSLTACAIVHRVGRLAVGETSVAIAVSASHRRAAFEAAQWLIDEIKKVVPIWKKENYADGGSEWIHPSRPSEAQPENSAREDVDHAGEDC